MKEIYFVDTSNRDTLVPRDQISHRHGGDTAPNTLSFQDLGESLFTYSLDIATVQASLITTESDNPRKILVNIVPFSDGPPKSNPDEMVRFLGDMSTGAGKINPLAQLYRKESQGKPHSWGPLVRAAAIHDELVKSGNGQPVLTIFNPIPGGALSPHERKLIASGNQQAFVRVMEKGLVTAFDRLHGYRGTFSEVSFAGQSIGAVRTVQMAHSFFKTSKLAKVGNVTAQEAVLYQESNVLRGLSKLTRDYMFQKYDSGSPNLVDYNADLFTRLPESQLRQTQDQFGAEPVGMIGRMLRGMVPRDMIGLTRSGERTTEAALELAENGVQVTFANAVDSAVSRYIRDWLNRQPNIATHPSLHSVLISPLPGQRLGHMVNEYATTTALVIAEAAARNRSK